MNENHRSRFRRFLCAIGIHDRGYIDAALFTSAFYRPCCGTYADSVEGARLSHERGLWREVADIGISNEDAKVYVAERLPLWSHEKFVKEQS